MRELAKRVPHGQLLELPKGGHFVYLEEPEAFARAVTRFLLQ
jgi:pimeloyl-ACP methyl ester carboxylesterase